MPAAGEQFASYTARDKFDFPLHAFRTEFMGYAHGLDAEFLCYEKRPFTLAEDHDVFGYGAGQAEIGRPWPPCSAGNSLGPSGP